MDGVPLVVVALAAVLVVAWLSGRSGSGGRLGSPYDGGGGGGSDGGGGSFDGGGGFFGGDGGGGGS